MTDANPFTHSGTQFSQHWPSLVSPDWWLNKAFIAATGQPKAAWRWTPGTTFLSTQRSVLTGVVIYLAMVFGGQMIMKNVAKPIRLKRITQIHNLLLTTISGFLLLAFMEQCLPVWRDRGFFFTICGAESWTQPMEILYYLNYLTKWLEFFDTVLLVLKKKKPEFLHYYHHSLTMVLCFEELLGRVSVAWIICSINLLVHVVMYYYYFMASCGRRMWWKEILTTLQIVQFVVDLFLCYFCLYTHVTFHAVVPLPSIGADCRGTRLAAYYGCVLLSSYLLLFVQFFIKTYLKGEKGNHLGFRSINYDSMKTTKSESSEKPEKPVKAE
ncbi:Fatty acyl-CoA elongase/Polyunsaturated fatty acid specific elongation enzyme [Coemansia sp. RSA 1813]|nr:Fatty acyl-CoA elongase/Polyunsaturated fatty acid specific elongation enzyme [Coemansia sp. RSA 1646]KAJ1771384.1 Fatty acyl-CoA elongase/Polyunsaturated fatty acid specific elongation enzyme [Coemansia sp. RSA 1843]KAJ2093157.1 Fatty acyl-CoA elongase/Polyunsaturated fatty acid specific elongation enzyme [Coemansia sp. RSA 986]KAJ2217577.1 Fatty acyl-CoA elongase/Polyunsaturated fatty acid specific elongation enzyme [Coemansia sp. RSA 487]KAJ2573410.1 Fatty acyl-CoA elongase/Polyunsaturate